MTIRPVLAAVALAIALAIPGAAAAHAFPTAEQPRVGSTVTASPTRVTIHYDARIETLFAHLEVLNAKGESMNAGPPIVNSSHRALSVPVKRLPPGNYTVQWSVVAEDGHRTEGSFPFTVAGQ